ncbi:MAG: condensation domain-containing protein, partial [Acidobacteria bacterium]|nr:condensation domain-containing protein [Acidobacteriota bacterium]
MKNESYSDQAVIAANQNVKEKDYWLNRLGGNLTRVSFPYNMNSGSTGRTGRKPIATICLDISGSLLEKLMKLSGGIDLKLHMVLVANLIALMHRYTLAPDITIGSPIIKQSTDTNIKGKFLNTILVYRHDIRENMNFKELLVHARETIIQATENQNFPVHILPFFLNLPEMDNEFPLFDVVLLLGNIHHKSYLYPVEDGYNMLFFFQREEKDNCIRANLEYNDRLYREQYAGQILNHYIYLLEKVLSNLELPLAYIDFLSEMEKDQLLNEFNGKDEEYPGHKMFHELYEEQVEHHPDNIAILGHGHASATRTNTDNNVGMFHITYLQLNEQSNRLAAMLFGKGVQPDDIIGLKTDRSVEMIIGVLGIWKSGGAYLPLDPEYPQERIDYMLKDSASKVLLINKSEIRNPKLETNPNKTNSNDPNKNQNSGAA